MIRETEALSPGTPDRYSQGRPVPPSAGHGGEARRTFYGSFSRGDFHEESDVDLIREENPFVLQAPAGGVQV